MTGATELIQLRGRVIVERYLKARDTGDRKVCDLCLDELRALVAIQRDVLEEAEIRHAASRIMESMVRHHEWEQRHPPLQ